jgi:hypothetical protein
MARGYLILNPASLSGPSAQWNEEDYRRAGMARLSAASKAATSSVGTPWIWTIFVIEDREAYASTHGYEATREGAMAAFAKSWRRL